MNIGVILNDQQLIIIHQLITFGNDVNVILFEKKPLCLHKQSGFSITI